MEVVQELLDAPKLKKEKKKEKKPLVQQISRQRNVRPGTSQQHGPKAFVWIRCPVSRPLYFSRSLQQACTFFFFAAQKLPSKSYRDPAGRGGRVLSKHFFERHFVWKRRDFILSVVWPPWVSLTITWTLRKLWKDLYTCMSVTEMNCRPSPSMLTGTFLHQATY